MASIYKRKGGYWTLQYPTPEKKVVRIHLGLVSERNAQRLRDKVEALVKSALFGMPPDEAAEKWAVSIAGTPLAKKLGRLGLLKQGCHGKLGDFIDEYILLRKDVKENTRKHMVSCRNRLVGFFSQDKPLADITKGDAEAFRIHLLGKFSQATTGRTLKSAIQFFQHALDSKLILENPFRKLKVPRETNEEKMFFVNGATARKVLEHCSLVVQRVTFALARFGGLRIPSELIRLRWSDIHWEEGRFLVHSPKTEHHEGKGKRWVPLFPELREILEEAYRLREEGEEFVCGRVRSSAINLRTGLLRVLKSAGIKPWPKLFANLRSSRETELVDNFPLHVVTRWIGHTPEVAKMHYLQTLDRHWKSAGTSRTVYNHSPGPEKPDVTGDVTG